MIWDSSFPAVRVGRGAMGKAIRSTKSNVFSLGPEPDLILGLIAEFGRC
jgi:hypothetical protein